MVRHKPSSIHCWSTDDDAKVISLHPNDSSIKRQQRVEYTLTTDILAWNGVRLSIGTFSLSACSEYRRFVILIYRCGSDGACAIPLSLSRLRHWLA